MGQFWVGPIWASQVCKGPRRASRIWTRTFAALCACMATSCAQESSPRLPGNVVSDAATTTAPPVHQVDSASPPTTGNHADAGVDDSYCMLGDRRDCYIGDEREPDVGICRRGTQDCVPHGEFTRWGDCLDQVTPVVEICGNDLDEDCNGIADDGCAEPVPDDDPEPACVSNEGEPCTGGRWEEAPGCRENYGCAQFWGVYYRSPQWLRRRVDELIRRARRSHLYVRWVFAVRPIQRDPRWQLRQCNRAWLQYSRYTHPSRSR